MLVIILTLGFIFAQGGNKMDKQNSRKGIVQEDKVSLQSLSWATGFPQDFISRELLFDFSLEGGQEYVDLEVLRESVIRYLNKTF